MAATAKWRMKLIRWFGSGAALTAVGAGTLALLALGGVANVTAALAAGDANQATCPFETEVSPGFRTYLPDCRAFELVTPPYKEAGVVVEEPGAVSTDGLHVIAESGGAFAGANNDWWNANRNPSSIAYEFTRTATGWQPEVLTPSAGQYPHSVLMAVSAENFGSTLWGAGPTDMLYNEDIYLRDGNGTFHLVGPGVAPEVAGEELPLAEEELNFVGASRNLSRSLFRIEASSEGRRQDHSNLWHGDTTEPFDSSLYEYAYSGAPNVEPKLVGVTNEGPLRDDAEARLISKCGTELGSGEGGSAYNAVSENGETVFFTALECAGGPAVNELYARIAGAETVNISEPSEEDCKACNTSTEPELGATFQGASQNGEKAFFTTKQEVLTGQEGRNLYEYDFNGPLHEKVTRVSACMPEPAECSAEARVQPGVVRVSENGERVYFVAKGKLTGSDRVTGREPEGAGPEEGADNLYVYEPNPADPGLYHTVFVANLLAPAEASALETEEAEEKERIENRAEKAAQKAEEEALEHGANSFEAKDIYSEVKNTQEHRLTGTLGSSGTVARDGEIWQRSATRPTQASPEDGDFLVFSSSAHLTAGDESKVPQLFEYDARKESLTLVSIAHGGPSDGSGETFADAPQIPRQPFGGVDLPTAADSGRAVSEDGSTVFFTSAAALAPQAEAGSTNVYEYRAGDVYLVSGGDDASVFGVTPTVALFGIDPTGQDAFFTTASQLVPQDGETQMALYDAREGGGFPATALEPGCVGEECRGPSAARPQPQLPGSASQPGGGTLTPSLSPTPMAKPKPKAKAKAKRCKKGLVRQKGMCVRKVRSTKAKAKRASDKRRAGR
jgi:hypothetical protein